MRAAWTLLLIAIGSVPRSALADEAPTAGFSPDPPPHATTRHVAIDLVYRDGRLRAERARLVKLEKPAATPRLMGRHALELYVGRELLDRYRFNVPLTGDGPPQPDELRQFHRPRFEHVTARLSVRIADHPRATHIVVLDRATGAAERYLWPPDADGRLLPMPPDAARKSAAPEDAPKGASKSSAPPARAAENASSRPKPPPRPRKDAPPSPK